MFIHPYMLPASEQPFGRTSLLAKSLRIMKEKLEETEASISDIDDNSQRATQLRVLLSLTLYRCEAAKMLVHEEMQGFHRARHLLRFGLKQSYRRVMEEVRRYDRGTATMFRQSTDFYDDVTASYLRALRPDLEAVKADLFELLRGMVSERGSEASEEAVRLCAGLYLCKVVLESVRLRMETEREAYLKQSIDISCTFALFPHVLEKQLSTLYERLTLEVFGHVREPLKQGEDGETTDLRIHLINLLSRLFSQKLAREVMELHNSQKE